MKKYDQYIAADRIDAHLHDNDIHYLTGEIANENATETIKWIMSANLNRKPKKTLKLYMLMTVLLITPVIFLIKRH